jgi:hypothetical protein
MGLPSSAMTVDVTSIAVWMPSLLLTAPTAAMRVVCLIQGAACAVNIQACTCQSQHITMQHRIHMALVVSAISGLYERPFALREDQTMQSSRVFPCHASCMARHQITHTACTSTMPMRWSSTGFKSCSIFPAIGMPDGRNANLVFCSTTGSLKSCACPMMLQWVLHSCACYWKTCS